MASTAAPLAIATPPPLPAGPVKTELRGPLATALADLESAKARLDGLLRG